jgi:hypothetical protein
VRQSAGPSSLNCCDLSAVLIRTSCIEYRYIHSGDYHPHTRTRTHTAQDWSSGIMREPCACMAAPTVLSDGLPAAASWHTHNMHDRHRAICRQHTHSMHNRREQHAHLHGGQSACCMQDTLASLQAGCTKWHAADPPPYVNPHADCFPSWDYLGRLDLPIPPSIPLHAVSKLAFYGGEVECEPFDDRHLHHQAVYSDTGEQDVGA